MVQSTLSSSQKIDDSKVEVIDSESLDDYLPQPPDGGWGWVVMVASFFISFIVDGIAYGFGVFLEEYVNYFNSSIGQTSLANSLLCGTYLLIGPIVGALVNRFGCQMVGVAGCLFSAAAFILSIFSPNIEFLIFSYGFLGGIGFGMVYLPSVIAVSYYFEKKRAIATGIAVCGTGIGTFCMAPFCKVLLLAYDWKNAHLILAGIILQGCFISALFRPLALRKGKKKTAPGEDGSKVPAIVLPAEEVSLMEATAPNAHPSPHDNPGQVAIIVDEIDLNNMEKRQRLLDPHHSDMRRRTSFSSALLRPEVHLSAGDRLHSSAFILNHSHRSINKLDLARPMYRKDIFYSGSIYNLPQSHQDVTTVNEDAVQSAAAAEVVGPSNRSDSCFGSLPKPMADILAEMLDTQVLRNPGMAVFCLANIVGMLGFYVPIIFTANRAEKLGVSQTDAAFLLSIMGICNTIGRVLFGFLAVIPKVSPLLLNNICMTLGGVAVLLMPFCVTYETMAFSIATYGLLCSTMISLASIILCDLVGLEKLTNGFGLLCLVRGITAIAGPPIEGLLYDSTGNYDATFYMGGACLILSGLLHFLLHLKCLQKKIQ